MADDRVGSPSAGRWRLLRVLLSFVLGLAAIDAVVAVNAPLWRSYDPNPYAERLEAYRREPHDLVVVGGSPVLYGVLPRVLKGARWRGQPLEHVFNLGLQLATTEEVYLAVKHGRAAPPRLLVYGVTATDLNEDRVEPQGPHRLMHLDDLVCWVRERPDAAGWGVRHFVEEQATGLWRLYYYRNGVRLWAADQAERFWPGACPEAAAEARKGRGESAGLASAEWGGGPIATPDHRLDLLKAAGKAEPNLPFMEHYRVGGAYPRALHRLLDWAEHRGVPVLLVDMPVPADLDERLYRREFAAYRALLAETARAHGVRVLYATRAAVGLTDADFADLIHLNADGATRLSAWLRRELEKPERLAVESTPAAGGAQGP